MVTRRRRSGAVAHSPFVETNVRWIREATFPRMVVIGQGKHTLTNDWKWHPHWLRHGADAVRQSAFHTAVRTDL
jgi:hypothetical protein